MCCGDAPSKVISRVRPLSQDVGVGCCCPPDYGNEDKMFVTLELIFFPFLKDGTTALLKAAIKGYNNVIEELLKFSPTLGLLKVSSETYNFRQIQRVKESNESP